MVNEHSMAPIINLNVTTDNSSSTDELNRFRVSVASSLALLVGLIQLAMGASGLGIISSYFSDAFISGYTCSSAIHVFTSQVKSLLGIKNAKDFEGALKIPKVQYINFNFRKIKKKKKKKIKSAPLTYIV
jgi:MFS superfamily sulfate permease-like transporter